MSYFQAFVLGLIQGLTEFLPVSSSGHLVLFSRITGVESSLYFDLILHLGTLVAVIIAFRRELTGLIRKPFSAPSLSLVLATAVSAVVVALLYKPAKLAFSGGKTLPIFFMLTAVLLTVGAYYRPKTVKPRHDFFTAAVVGFCQGVLLYSVRADYLRLRAGGNNRRRSFARARRTAADGLFHRVYFGAAVAEARQNGFR